jgi:CheY-like chemotaxis protein
MFNFPKDERPEPKNGIDQPGGAIMLVSDNQVQRHFTIILNILRKLSSLNTLHPEIRADLGNMEHNIHRMFQLLEVKQHKGINVLDADGIPLHPQEKSTQPCGMATFDSMEELDLLSSDDGNHPEACGKNKEKILIVDDDYEIRYFIKNVLNEKYTIVECSNGSEAYDKIMETVPDLIISDIVMPGMNGIDLCKKIKSDVRTSHIPIVLLTGRTADPQRLQGYEAGADAYINKPFNTVELTLRVRNLLETLHNQRKRYPQDIFQTPRQITTNSTDEIFLHRVIKYVEDNIDDPSLDIAGLASELNMSSSNLYRKVKSITGMSSIDFVINHKMKFAAHLLLSGTYSVKEVAYMVGFTDARYFSTRFKKYFSCTPTEYCELTIEKINQEAASK